MNETPRVVVGVDGSGESLAALAYGMEQAARRGTGVRVVSAFLPPQYWPSAYGLSAPPTIEEVKDELRTIANRMVEQVVAAQESLAYVPIEQHEVAGWPAKVLIEQAREADLLVVGHRGRGRFTSALLGSVGLHCVLHAKCPVAVVPTRAQDPDLNSEAPADANVRAHTRRMHNEGLIVVGVDGSVSARTAFKFALEAAARQAARVRVVTVYHPRRHWPVAFGLVVPASPEELVRAAERTARQTVADVLTEVGSTAAAVPVEVRAVPGNPATVLLDEAADADLLVVGHRGLGGVASACLGSVGLQCVLHATCPLTVVRPVAASVSDEMPAARATMSMSTV